MTRHHGRRAALAAVAAGGLVAAAGCVEVDRGDPAKPGATGDDRNVPLEIVDQGGYVLAFVRVSISGEGPYRFALDTGASVTALDTDIAEDLDLPTVDERLVTGITGTQPAEIVEVDEWQLGELPLEPAEIALIDLPDPERGEALDGLLGSDLLIGFGEVVVDYDGEQLRLSGG